MPLAKCCVTPIQSNGIRSLVMVYRESIFKLKRIFLHIAFFIINRFKTICQIYIHFCRYPSLCRYVHVPSKLPFLSFCCNGKIIEQLSPIVRELAPDKRRKLNEIYFIKQPAKSRKSRRRIQQTSSGSTARQTNNLQ